MNQSITFSNHPFKFLLYLEWILLAIAIVTEIASSHFPLHHYELYADSTKIIICVQIIFSIMGLRIPNGSLRNKIIYTAIEVGLISLAGFFGSRSAKLFPFLYLILVTRSCLIFQLPGRLVVTTLSFTLFLITLSHRVNHIALSPSAREKFGFFPLNLALVFSLDLIFIILLMNSLLAERQIRENLSIANEKLRRYALQIESQATLEERNRIAREIHDSLGHSLTALNLQLETGVKLLGSNPTKATEFLSRAKELGSKALQDVRHSVSTMRNHPLQEKSLEQLIRELLEDFHRSRGILPISVISLDCPLPTEIATAIYRIVQESLTNISKYADASETKLELTTKIESTTKLKTKPKTEYIELIIQDNGKGFDLNQNTTGFGLRSMSDRALTLGGDIQINSAHGCGCEIIVHIPLTRQTS
jgi:signal transduction histidine kinase